MKLTLQLFRDSDMSDPGDISFEDTGNEYVYIEISGRELSVKKDEFLRLCSFLLMGSCAQTPGTKL